MENNNAFKKLKALFVLRIIVAILGVIAVIIFTVNKYVKIMFSNVNVFKAILIASVLTILIFILLVFLFIKRKKPMTSGLLGIISFLIGIGLLLITFSVYGITYGIITHSIIIEIAKINIFSLYLIFIFLALFIFCIIYAFISKKRKILIFHIKRLVFSCENDNNLWDLIGHYNSAIKMVKKSKYLLTFGKDKLILIDYEEKLVLKKQDYIKNAILKHYKIICEIAETKNLYLSKKVYNACLGLKNSINKYYTQFDEENKKLSLIILEKTNLIINFTEKYLNVYNTSSRYNIDEMKGQDFEKYCANLLIAYGFVNVQVTRGSGDQGVDIIGSYNNLKYAIQCKRYSHKLSNTPIQEVAAGKNYYNCQRALVITNNFFTDGAVELAKANNVELWDRDQLMQLIYYTDNQWINLLEKIKIDFQETNIIEKDYSETALATKDNVENNTIEQQDKSSQQHVKGQKWRCSKCGLEVISDYDYCPFCKYVEKSDYKNEAKK